VTTLRVVHNASTDDLGKQDAPVPRMSLIDDDNKDVLAVADVAALLKIGRNAVYEAVSRGVIPHRRIGKHIRFSRRGLMRWLASWSWQGAKEGK
jgi:excisionase family DNA binding protein